MHWENYGWNTGTRPNEPTRLEWRSTERFHRSEEKKAGEDIGGWPREDKDQKKPAPTVNRGDRPDNCGSKERRRRITFLRSENFSSRIGTCVLD